MPAFKPLVGERPHTLILGSMPSQVSLADQQYYANTKNAFWWIMSQLYGFSSTLDYERRVDKVISQGVAVWDVLHDCLREGSLDANIQQSSEQVNDFPAFLKQYPTIKLIAFNGAAAKNIFIRHCSDVFTRKNITWQQLPSSSPAYAAITRNAKLAAWRECLGVTHS